jgi:hypothetical protein
MGIVLLTIALLLTGCAKPPAEPPKPDPTAEPWYAAAVADVVRLQSEAEALLKEGRADEAGARVTETQPLTGKLLSVPKPTLEAVKAASGIDDLYGRMLMRNRHYGWARMQFQKNVARWRSWSPQTEETRQLRQHAEAAMAECDRLIANQSR